MTKRKATVSTRDCVACGCCMKVCPKNIIDIFNKKIPIFEVSQQSKITGDCQDQD